MQAQGPKYGKDAILVGDLIRASQFIGKEVRNQQNERLGKVDDLVLDLRSGQVAYTVLAEGGVLGIGEKLFAIPLQAFQAPEGGDRVVLRADREQVAKAPGFDKDNWPTTANPYWTQRSGS
jgi:sporulation protein YlmC with PRC-barrel domain